MVPPPSALSPPDRPSRDRRGESRPGVPRLLPVVSRLAAAGRLGLALVLGLVGLALAVGGGLADRALHRGVETGGELPYVQHLTGRDLATNIDLTRFEPRNMPGVAATLQASGFRYARQSFAWSEIEPTRGVFDWSRYDALVDALTKRGITPLAVLHRSPAWARAPDQGAAFDAPPMDPRDFARFVEEVVRHFGPKLPIVQLWDLPNRADHWGGAVPDAVAYADLVKLGGNAARGANATAAVVLAEFDPRPRPTADGDDLAFLRAVYRSGAAPFFQVVAARVDGGDRPPSDRRVEPGIANLSRAALFREIMVEVGDGGKPIWATHYGWRASDGPNAVGSAERAAFTVAGLQRARAEWPWMGLMFAWGFVPGGDLGGDLDPSYTLLREDGAITPLLAALAAFAATGGSDLAPTGFLPVEARQFNYEGNWAIQHLDQRTYRTTSEVGARTTLRFQGTGLIAIVRLSPQAGDVMATLDGAPLAVNLGSFQAADVPITLADDLADGTHELTLELADAGQLTVGGVVVRRSMPLRWSVVLLAVFGLGFLCLGLREVAYAVAERTGHLQRRRGVDLWPELPPIPDWRPARRA